MNLEKENKNRIKLLNNLKGLTIDEIVKVVNKVDDIERMLLWSLAIDVDVRLALKIKCADRKIKKARIENFMKSLKNNDYERFLDSLTIDEKRSLQQDLGISKLEENPRNLSPQEQKCHIIIEQAIKKDYLTIAHKKGYGSYEEMLVSELKHVSPILSLAYQVNNVGTTNN